ncbi:MAG: dihydroorotate dehydrogenase-like protein [Acidobacteriota bacterium]
MNLATTYMGFRLKNPIVPSACAPLSNTVPKVRALEDSGAAAIVLHSLFEEEILHESLEMDHYLSFGTESYAEALNYFPHNYRYSVSPDEYLEHVHRVKRAVDIPVIASLNGVSSGGWIDYARKIEQAGADALELNVYYIATDIDLPGIEVEQMYVNVLTDVNRAVSIPVAIKLGPYFSSMGHMAKRLVSAGAGALVLFNRFYQPDIDIEVLEVEPNLVLSSSVESRLPMRWIAILYGRIEASLAATSGIDSAEDALKMIMAGADVTMVCSTLLRHGPMRISDILKGMVQWMELHEYESVEQMKGSMSQRSCAQPAAFERANYMKALKSYV